MPAQLSENAIEPLIPILRSQAIPSWERFGMDRLAVTAKTLKQFQAQSPPELMRTSVKKRIGKRVTSRNKRDFNNTNSFLERWPEDDQATFRFPTLVFIVEGQADFHVADYVIHCPQHHFLLFGTGVPRPAGNRPHLEGRNLNRQNCSVLWFFAPAGTRSVISYICHSEGAKHRCEGYRVVHRPAIIHLYQLVIEEFERQTTGHKDVSSQLFEAFLHLFLRELQEGNFHLSGHSSNRNVEESSSSIGQTLQYIKTHLNRPLTADSVAQFAYMSRSSFLQYFKRETGQTFHEFVTQQRMQEAGRLLSEGYWSISYVCKHIGLRPTQFGVQFKKHFGVPPSEFRSLRSKKI